jgi:hypothetical protein
MLRISVDGRLGINMASAGSHVRSLAFAGAPFGILESSPGLGGISQCLNLRLQGGWWLLSR